jgi:hypothetical protein
MEGATERGPRLDDRVLEIPEEELPSRRHPDATTLAEHEDPPGKPAQGIQQRQRIRATAIVEPPATGQREGERKSKQRHEVHRVGGAEEPIEAVSLRRPQGVGQDAPVGWSEHGSASDPLRLE